MDELSWRYGIIHCVQNRGGNFVIEVEDFEEGVMYRFRGDDEQDQRHGDRVHFLPEKQTWRGRPCTRRVMPRI